MLRIHQRRGQIFPTPYSSPVNFNRRYALNFKCVDYRTQWVELPDVTSTRRNVLNMPPTRTHLDGSDYYTLPVIHDTSTDTKVGDSFDIAVYLDKTYPDPERCLFPPRSKAIMCAWNEKCNAIFSGTNNTFGSVGLLYAHGLPFNPATAEQSKAKFVATVPGMTCWDDFNLTGDARTKALRGFKIEMNELGSYFRKRKDGPFLEGRDVTYADFIVGGWLKFLSVSLLEWDQVRTWDEGLWEKLHQALEKEYGEVR
jgi:glutathione S-transferase